MNETAVRESILAPLLAKLGYQYGTTNYIEYEEQLETIIYQLGRKSRKDYPIGRPDYRCGIDGQRGSFIVEAKEGAHTIDANDIAQAHSYAAHGLVSARFFVLSNGHEFQIYDTYSGVKEAPILVVRVADFDRRFHEIDALLGPRNLRKYSHVEYDLSQPLSPDLPSRAQLKFGWASMPTIEMYLLGRPRGEFASLLQLAGIGDTFSELIEQYKKNRQPIIDGDVRRAEDGRIQALLEFDSIDKRVAGNIIKMGFKKMLFVTDDEYISNNIEKPTIFETISESNIPRGTELYSPISEKNEPAVGDIDTFINIKAAGAVHGNKFFGHYTCFAKMNFQMQLLRLPPLINHYDGDFEIEIKESL